MTDRVKTSLGKLSTVLAIAVILVTSIASVTRAIDASTQALQGVERLSARVDRETTERMEDVNTLAESVTAERDARKDEYTKIQVKLSEIDTRLLYIQQGIDSLK